MLVVAKNLSNLRSTLITASVPLTVLVLFVYCSACGNLGSRLGTVDRDQGRSRPVIGDVEGGTITGGTWTKAVKRMRYPWLLGELRKVVIPTPCGKTNATFCLSLANSLVGANTKVPVIIFPILILDTRGGGRPTVAVELPATYVRFGASPGGVGTGVTIGVKLGFEGEPRILNPD